MGSRGGGPNCWWLPLRQPVLVLAVIASCCYCPQVAAQAQQQKCKTPPVIFNFGDSNSDTGGLSSGLGYIFPAPEGRVYFDGATGRLCDGRLIIDFLCDGIGTRTLRPYLDAVGIPSPNFTNGANFAVAGAAVLPPATPFSLFIQVLQFVRFQSLCIDNIGGRQDQLVSPDGFRTALYTLDIGQNDLSAAFSSNTPFDQIIATKIPAVLDEIKTNVLNLYAHGARKFWVHNTGPLGCLPQMLATLPRNNGTAAAGELDSVGCLAAPNNAARAFNTGLARLCDQLRKKLKQVTVVYVDVFSIKYDVIARSASWYGFDGPPLMACCGHGGPPYNYDSNVQCLQKGSQPCAEGTRYISWDGVNYSDQANSIFSPKIFSGNYSTPPISFNAFCNI